MRAAVLSGVEPGSASETQRRRAVRSGQELHVRAEGFVLAGVPGVHLPAFAVQVGARDAVRREERAVQDHVTDPPVPALLQNLVKIRGLSCENVDTLMQVPVTGGLRDARVPGQAVHTPPLTEPAQHQHRLPERPQRPRTLRRPQRPAPGSEQPRNGLNDMARNIEHGNIRDQREAPGVVDDLVRETSPTRGFTPVRSKDPPAAQHRPSHSLQPTAHFAEKTSRPGLDRPRRFRDDTSFSPLRGSV